MSVEDLFLDHVRLLRRIAGEDALAHPVDEFEVIDEFWVMFQRDGAVAARSAAGILDLSPISALLPVYPPIYIATDRLEVVESEMFPEGQRLRFQDIGMPSSFAEYREARVLEELPS